jgi:CheY-like chemotaxis protein
MSLLKNKRIFIVEDNEMNRVVYQITLRIHGAWIEFDRMGRDTISGLERFKPDLIILDLMLTHGNSGYTIFDQIRALPDYAEIPIIAVSATDCAIAMPKTQEMGFDGFIAKPIDDIRFPQQIADILAGEKIWDAGNRSLS